MALCQGGAEKVEKVVQHGNGTGELSFFFGLRHLGNWNSETHFFFPSMFCLDD